MTVLGKLPAEELGPTDCHEHLFIRGGLPVVLEPEFRLDDVDAAIAEVGDFAAAGGAALVDCMPLGVGRDAEGLVTVAQRTGLTVIAATGFHKDRYYAADHWVRDYSADRITELVVAEYAEGMERSGYNGPDIHRLDARPGLIKVASGDPGPTPTERKLLVAGADAAVETGLPILTHSESFEGAATQLETITGRGVPAERILLSHVDRHGPADQPKVHLDRLTELLDSGATACLDWLGRTDRRPDSVVAGMVAGLFERGYADRVVLGQDLARRQYWTAYGGGPGLAHLFRTVVPLLRDAGLDDDQVEQVMVRTPRRVLSVQPVQPPAQPGARAAVQPAAQPSEQHARGSIR